MSYPFAQRNITMSELINYIKVAANNAEDFRLGTNCKYKNMSDFVLGAFAVFFFQDESFLKNQRRMKDEIGNSNAQTLFDMEEIPKRSAIAEMLDKISPEHIMPIFDNVFDRLKELKIIESYKYNALSNQLLMALDGTQYFDSEDIHCEKCLIKTNNQYACGLFLVKAAPSSIEEAKLLLGKQRYAYFITELGELFFIKKTKKSKKKSLQRIEWITKINIPQNNLNQLKTKFLGAKNSLCLGIDQSYIEVIDKLSSEQLEIIEKITGHAYYNKKYVHQMITPILLHPESNHVISLQPEFIVNHDGYEKQDCEQNAAKRWLEKHGEKYAQHGVTILGDDLYSTSVFCKYLLSMKMNFILVCKEGSHKGLYKWLGLKQAGIQEKKITTTKNKKKLMVTYRYINDINITAEEKSLTVNWIEITEIEETTGDMKYHNAFVTNNKITEANCEAICVAGRAKWKIENENNNELKNHGYNLGHNYGHGSQYLSQNLALLNILAFLFHTVMALTSNIYDFIRNKFSSKKEIFEHFRVITEYLCFKTWDDLLLKLAKKSQAEIDKIYKEKCLEPP